MKQPIKNSLGNKQIGESLILLEKSKGLSSEYIIQKKITRTDSDGTLYIDFHCTTGLISRIIPIRDVFLEEDYCNSYRSDFIVCSDCKSAFREARYLMFDTMQILKNITGVLEKYAK